MVASPYYGVVELQIAGGADTGKVICRPIKCSDVDTALVQFIDDGSYEVTKNVPMWLVDIKINPGAAGANPATDTTSLQVQDDSNPAQYENWVDALMTTRQVRPKPYFMAAGRKLQLKQLKRA